MSFERSDYDVLRDYVPSDTGPTGEPVYRADSLPPAKEPARTGLQSADPVLSTCVHELARALEEYARKQYVALFAGDIEFETAAIEISKLLHVEKCPVKNV